MPQLLADCLDEIFEYLDRGNLRSCLLVNRLWCKISVRILWINIRNYNTLIACLPSESKEILSKNGIITSTLAAPMFNYPSFCKVLIVNVVNNEIGKLFKNKQSIVTREIFKLLMNQISSLKNIVILLFIIPKFTSFPGANNCLKDLKELHCRSDIDSELLYQLSQICCNIQSLRISFDEVISNGLADLISSQQNLDCLNLLHCSECCEGLPKDIITSR